MIPNCWRPSWILIIRPFTSNSYILEYLAMFTYSTARVYHTAYTMMKKDCLPPNFCLSRYTVAINYKV